MAKGKSGRGMRTEDPGAVDKSVPVTDERNPKNRAEPEQLIPDDQTSTPPGPAFKDKHDLP